jgi:hypothetical protein
MTGTRELDIFAGIFLDAYVKAALQITIIIVIFTASELLRCRSGLPCRLFSNSMQRQLVKDLWSANELAKQSQMSLGIGRSHRMGYSG